MPSIGVKKTHRPLGISNHVELSERLETRLRLVEAYDMAPVILRLRRKKLLPTHMIEPAVAEFKRFIALIVLGHRGISLNSPEVDEVWHTFILFTSEYTAFCRKVAGRYIHHRPSESAVISDREGQSLLPLYERYFGEASQSEVRVGLLREASKAGCQGCDDCGVM